MQVKFVQNGPAHGFGHFAGDVIEMEKKKADELIRKGVVIPHTEPTKKETATVNPPKETR